MKLRRKNEGLSDSLLNNSQVKEVDNDVKIDILKSEAVIRASKNSKIISKLNFVKTQNTDPLNKGSIIKSSRKNAVKKFKITDIEEGNKSLIDLVIPKKKSKLTKSPKDDNPRSSNVIVDDELKVKSATSKIVIFSPSSPKKSENSSTNEISGSIKNLFKTPIIPNTRKKSVKSPLCASSPIIEKRKSSNIFDSEPDLFSSEIISSSEDFKSCKSSITSKKSMFSPIKDLKSIVPRRKTIDKKSSSLKTKSSNLEKPIKKSKISSKSLPVITDSLVRTRSGRISRSFHETETGKFIYQLFYESFHKIK